jgi:hypothetical protein
MNSEAAGTEWIRKADAQKLTWAEETMLLINKLTPDIKGKAFDPDWFLLRQRLEQFEAEVVARNVQTAPELNETCPKCGSEYRYNKNLACAHNPDPWHVPQPATEPKGRKSR